MFPRFGVIFIFCMLVALVFSGCFVLQKNTVAQVKITADGRLFLNGEEATIDQLRTEFARLKEVDGTVEYYREAPEQEPHPIVDEVMAAIVEARLPIRFSETDFE